MQLGDDNFKAKRLYLQAVLYVDYLLQEVINTNDRNYITSRTYTLGEIKTMA